MGGWRGAGRAVAGADRMAPRPADRASRESGRADQSPQIACCPRIAHRYQPPPYVSFCRMKGLSHPAQSMGATLTPAASAERATTERRRGYSPRLSALPGPARQVVDRRFSRSGNTPWRSAACPAQDARGHSASRGGIEPPHSPSGEARSAATTGRRHKTALAAIRDACSAPPGETCTATTTRGGEYPSPPASDEARKRVRLRD